MIAGTTPLLLATTQTYLNNHPIGRVFFAVAVASGLIELAGAGRRRAEATRRDSGSLIVLRVCAIPAVVLLILSPRIASFANLHPPLAFAIAGTVVFASGEGLRIWSKTALGRYFTYTVQTSADQPVITSGPYRLVRHPSYTGILLMALGTGLAWANWLGLAAMVVGFSVGLRYRISVEEKALVAELGDRYQAYAADHKRLIPFVW